MSFAARIWARAPGVRGTPSVRSKRPSTARPDGSDAGHVGVTEQKVHPAADQALEPGSAGVGRPLPTDLFLDEPADLCLLSENRLENRHVERLLALEVIVETPERNARSLADLSSRRPEVSVVCEQLARRGKDAFANVRARRRFGHSA
jgi:hypothetical protein